MGDGSHIEFSDDEVARRKKAVFDSMGTRAQKRILKKGFDEWDPFEDPKDPIDIRTDVSKRTTQDLVQEFLREGAVDNYSPLYAEGVMDVALGLVNDNDKIKGMYDFSNWYRQLLIREGHVSEGE